MRKVSAHWVPHHLTFVQAEHRLQVATAYLSWLNTAGENFLSRIVAIDETSVSQSWRDNLLSGILQAYRCLQSSGKYSQNWTCLWPLHTIFGVFSLPIKFLLVKQSMVNTTKNIFKSTWQTWDTKEAVTWAFGRGNWAFYMKMLHRTKWVGWRH